MVNTLLLFIHTPHRFAELPCLRGAVPSGEKADHRDSSPKVGEVPFRAEGYEPPTASSAASCWWKNQRFLFHTPHRFARPPTLGGQSLRLFSERRCMIFSVPTPRPVLNKGFPVFGQSAGRCSPKVGELPVRVRGMSRGVWFIPPPLRSSPYLRGTVPAVCSASEGA